MFLLGYTCGAVSALLFAIAVIQFAGRASRRTVSVRGMKVALESFDRPPVPGLDS